MNETKCLLASRFKKFSDEIIENGRIDISVKKKDFKKVGRISAIKKESSFLKNEYEVTVVFQDLTTTNIKINIDKITEKESLIGKIVEVSGNINKVEIL